MGGAVLYGIRYHIITLIAVFLALGLGLLLGGTLGEEVIVKEQVQLLQRLEERYTQSKADNSKLHKQQNELEQRAQALEQVMGKVGGHYVQDRLIGKQIAVMQVEPGDVTSLLTTLEQAGANVITTAQLRALPFDDAAHLQSFKDKLGLAAGADVKTCAQRLADALVNELFFQSGTTVLNQLKEANLAVVTGTPGQRPDAVVLVGGASDQSKQRLQLWDVPLMQALTDRDLQVVGVEHSTAPHSSVTYYREFGISTVDNVDQVTGRVALIDILGGAKGHFGIKKTAEALLPQVTTAKEVSTGR